MAIRYRIIQYEGNAADVERLIARGVNGTFKPGNVKITAWETQHGDIVETRAGLPEWPRSLARPSKASMKGFNE